MARLRNLDPADAKARGTAARRRWTSPPLALTLTGVFAIGAAGMAGVAVTDWAEAVHQARGDAAAYAFHRVGLRFRGRDWRPALIPGVVSATVNEPPRGGAYAGYRFATHVVVVRQWRPRLAWLVGGPYRITGRSTAAVLRNRRGQWTPIVVE